MVWISRVCLRKYGGFVDNLRLYVKGGSGGMGLPRLGGQGGKGGDVWVIAKESITLKKVKDMYPQKRLVAGVGTNSSIRALKGDKGNDQQVFAPTGIVVTTDDRRILGELNAVGDKVLVARGGQGGSFHMGYLPNKGQARHIRLDLKLIADVGLVGFPNAGKSSLLAKLSHARPQVASYPFTTLRPELGKIMYNDYKQVSVADLPGLIEGAHMNKGMGHKFLKHVERTKQLVFVVDVCGFQLSAKSPFRTAFETVQLLTKELELYSDEMLSKPAFLVLNKMDLPDAEQKLEELMGQLQNQKDFAHLLPDAMVPKSSLSFRQILPVSALTGHGIEDLKACIRQTLDEQAAAETADLHRACLQELRETAWPNSPKDSTGTV
ncbi:GTP-binding protein 10 [Paramormyrops kingsleyae]|uniref:GTP-binding protein 10 n=1 Tax=Paramormyrops kingsleyae TaxID=1676925 RepID=A0A3B3R4L4_9TELE|nr:GTP-binding protein 10 [Paramormyrops kingsleyae]